jgi:hypothetical protein
VAGQLIFVDESGVNLSSGEKTHGWGKKGNKIPYKTVFQKRDNFSILPAMNVEGYMAINVYKGGVNSATFEDFIINEVLPKCHPYPGPNSIIVMDNAAIHNMRVHS